MVLVHNMLNIKDEQESASALCHCGYFFVAKAQVLIYLGSQNHSDPESAR